MDIVSRKLRIGYVVPGFPGQTHIFFWRELHALRALGVDAQIVSTCPPDPRIQSHTWAREAKAATHYLFPMTPSEFLSSLRFLFRRGWRVRSELREGLRCSSVRQFVRNVALLLVGAKLAERAEREYWSHMHVHSCADAALVVSFAGRMSNVPYSMTLHGPLEDYGPQQPFKWAGSAFGIVITRKLLSEASLVLNGSLPDHVEVAPMGVDLTRVKRSRPYRPWTGSGIIRIVSCGRLNSVKGHQDLIEAVAILVRSGYEVSLHICGQDESGGDGYARNLQGQVDQLGLGNAVTLLGAVSEDRVLEELENAHVFALASYHEPLGVAYMEAMAMNVPTIGTNSGGVTELISDGVDGLLVQPRRPSDLADAVLKILLQPEFASRLSEAGRQKVARNFHSGISALAIQRHLLGSHETTCRA